MLANAAATVFLTLQFLVDPCNVFLIIPDVSPEYCHLAFQLLMGGFQHIDLHPGIFQFPIPLTQKLRHLLRLEV